MDSLGPRLERSHSSGSSRLRGSRTRRRRRGCNRAREPRPREGDRTQSPLRPRGSDADRRTALGHGDHPRTKELGGGQPPKTEISKHRARSAPPLLRGAPTAQAYALLAIAFLSWLAATTALPYLISGGPTAPTPGCRYRLVNHGDYTCVSHSRYIAARDAERRFVAGIFCGFFVVQFGIAAAELRRRRVAARQALA